MNSIGYLIRQGFSSIWKNRLMSFASICVLMVSLLFIGLSILTGMNVNRIVKDIEKTNEILIYLDNDITDEEIEIIQQKLMMLDNISSINFYSKEQAFADLKSSMTGNEDLFELIGEESPLPDSYRIKVHDTSLINDTVETISLFDNVGTIQAPYDFADILNRIKKLVSILSITILSVMTIVSMIIISNATKASAFSRRREINIMKYVGATNTFICIPFFIEGMITGVIAGCMAFFVTMFGYNSLIDIMMDDLEIWIIIGSGGLIPFADVSLQMALAYIGIGAVIGSFGCVLSTKKYLNV